MINKSFESLYGELTNEEEAKDSEQGDEDGEDSADTLLEIIENTPLPTILEQLAEQMKP